MQDHLLITRKNRIIVPDERFADLKKEARRQRSKIGENLRKPEIS
jgi:hypothetical protein